MNDCKREVLYANNMISYTIIYLLWIKCTSDIVLITNFYTNIILEIFSCKYSFLKVKI